MKIVKYGTVTIDAGPIRVEGWLVEREDSDPPEADPEALLLATVISWARKKFSDAANTAAVEALLEAQANENIH